MLTLICADTPWILTATNAADSLHVGELNGDGRHDIVVPTPTGVEMLYGAGL